MATAGGTPPTGTTSKPKREWTPLQKFGLPIIGGLSLIVGYMYLVPKGGTTPPPPVANVAMNTSAAPSTAPPTGVPSGTINTVPSGAGTLPATGAVPLAFVSRARTDPFEPVMLYSPDAPPPPTPRPTPKPKPAPKPPPPVSLPPLPGAGEGFDGGAGTPVTLGDPGGRSAVNQSLGLPGPEIRRTTDGAPRDAVPLPRTSGGAGGGGDAGGAPQQSYDKRLAGVIIGDGVRALLEITAGDQVTTQVVQPGDEVNGIRVLNIERFREGDRTITRMIVRDTDGTQRIVELKPSPQAATGAAGAGGAIGAPG